MPAPPPTYEQLTTSFLSQNLPPPSPSFLEQLLTSSALKLPADRILPAITATAKHRIIKSDITTCLLLSLTTPSFPTTLSDVHVPSSTLPHDIFIQIIDIDDLSKSTWEQIEALESERKGETTKGREIIRVVATPGDGDNGSSASTQAIGGHSSALNNAQSKGPFKLLMQDWKGGRMYGFELKKVDKVGFPPIMNIGCKILLKKGAKVARGMVLLEPNSVVVLGGRIEELDKAWQEGREASLRERVKKQNEERVAAPPAARGGRGGRGDRGRGA